MLNNAIASASNITIPVKSAKVAIRPKFKTHLYYFENFSLDSKRHTLHHATQEITITSGLFDLLLAFVRHPQEVLSRDTLIALTNRGGYEPFDRCIDIAITRLRRCLNDRQFRLIKTIRHRGYLFSCEVHYAQ